jgi:uncharacterized protein YndB with AHSA1/START domain
MLRETENEAMPIIWPKGFETGRTAAHVSNEITIGAPAETVWACLVQAGSWPGWYPNSADVHIQGGGDTLGPGVTFTWRTFGVKVACTVAEWQPYSRIAWRGTGTMIEVYHAWLIETRPGGCFVLTEENQNGLAARAQAAFMPDRMFKGHALWLERLKVRAEAAGK